MVDSVWRLFQQIGSSAAAPTSSDEPFDEMMDAVDARFTKVVFPTDSATDSDFTD